MDRLASSKKKYIQLSKLQSLSAALLRAKTISEVGSIILEKGFEVLGAVSGEVSIFDEKTNRFAILAFKGYGKEILEAFKGLPKKSSLVIDTVIKTKKPFVIDNVVLLDDKYEFAHYFLKKHHFQSAIILPMRVTGKTIGVLQFFFRNKQNYSSEDKSFMYNLADQCAQALDKIIALEATKHARDEMDIILRGIDDAVIVRNPEGEITFVNDAAIRLHGCSKGTELLNLSLEEYFNLFKKPVDDQGNQLKLEKVPFMQVFLTKKPTKGIYYKELAKTNKGYWLKITSLPILNNNGTIEFVVSVLHDISEEKRNEESKDEFFGIASHELKTPVTSLKAYTQVLKKRFEKEKNFEVANYLQKMDTQIDKLTNLIHDLLDVTKIEGGKLRFYNELFEFNELAKDIVEQIQLTTSHKIMLYVDRESILFCDRERVGQVIINFLTNAVKYSPDNKSVIVRVKKRKGVVIFSVQDFGIGIEKEDQKHIFERFYRERNLKGDTFPGLGLGLYIASEVIRRQRGKIWVESAKNEGSTFYFQLPLAKKQTHLT